MLTSMLESRHALSGKLPTRRQRHAGNGSVAPAWKRSAGWWFPDTGLISPCNAVSGAAYSTPGPIFPVRSTVGAKGYDAPGRCKAERLLLLQQQQRGGHGRGTDGHCNRVLGRFT